MNLLKMSLTLFHTHEIAWHTMAAFSQQIVPPLVTTDYKGQMGRIAIVGGSRDYTGAPFYAAESALKFGADLAFVFCSQQAATPIKCYSPEVMVTPFYDDDTIEDTTTCAVEKNEKVGRCV